MSDAQAKKFYEVHAERPFYGELVPWTEFSPTDLAKRLRMVPSSAWAGLVAPITPR
jgi:hypothetical protein